MATRLIATLMAALAGLLLLAALAGAASLVGIYRNGMDTASQREQVVKVYGERCKRDAAGKALRLVVGKRTRECAYRTPVVGRDLEIAATERLLGETPVPLQHTAFLALSLRGDGSSPGYQLLVYPFQRKVQLREVLPDGQVKYLDIEKNVESVAGVDKANELRLRAFDATAEGEAGTAKGEGEAGAGKSCRILAFVGGKLVAEATDEAAGELQGRLSGFSVGAATSAKDLAASVDNVVVRVPSPF